MTWTKFGTLGDHHHAAPDTCDSEISSLASSLHPGAYLRGDRAPLVGDSGAALGRRAVERRENPNLKALGEG